MHENCEEEGRSRRKGQTVGRKRGARIGLYHF